MRILVTVPWGRRLGGAEEMLQMALEGASGAGHELELVFFEPGPWPEELLRAGFHVEVIPAGRLRQAHRVLATVVRLAGVFRARRPDLILNWMTKTQLYGSPAAVLAGMSDRVVWWQHGMPGEDWLGRCATWLPAIAIGCTSSTVARAQSQMRPRRATFVVAAGARVPDACSGRAGSGEAILGDTGFGRESLELSKGLSRAFPQDLHELPDDVPVVGIVGRLQPWKGQDRLLRAQALLRERGHEVHVLIVGGDAYGLSSEYAASLPGLVGELGLTGAVTMTGQVPDAGPYIAHMDILVNASDPEPFGLVLLEGMARGVAVVAVDSGGPAEIIDDRQTGVLARSGEPSDLADALEALLLSSELRTAIGRAGRERFMRDFTAAAMCGRFFAQLESLVSAESSVGTEKSPGSRLPAQGVTRKPCDVTLVAHHVGSVGGMERQLAELALGLRELGHEVTVIAHACELPASAGVVFHRVPGPSRPFLLGYPWFMLAGSLAVRRWRRGVVHVAGAIVLNRVDVIAVHYCHQVGTITPSRNTWPFRAHVKAMGVMSRLGERLCFRAHTSVFVCVSEGVAEEIREHYPRLSGRILTIHNGVDTDTFAPGAHREQARAMRAAHGIPERRLVAAFVGGEWERKGLQAAIEALASSPEWDLVVAGAGDETRYRQLADALGVGDRVHWLGVLHEVQIVYGLADAFVLPTSYETFSLVTFEAAASGLPVLATPVSGVRELIEDGRNGFLITKEPRMIAERLRQLAADPQLRVRLGREARHSALAFGWRQMVRKHHELYSRLAGQS